MTCLPPSRVKSPVCEAVTSMVSSALIVSAKPSARSMAGAAPVVPSSWTTLILPSPLTSESAALSTSHWPAFSPSTTKSEPRKRLVERGVLGVDGAVGEDHRDVGGLGLLQDGVPPGLDDGAEGDDVDLLLDVGADRLDLVLLLALGVGELQVDARVLGRVLDRRGVGGPPAALGADLGEAHRDRAAVGGAVGAAVGVAAAGGERERAQGDRARRDQSLLQHWSSSRSSGSPPCDRCH